MSQLLLKDIAEMIEKRLRGEISQNQLSHWAWEAHWADETRQRPYDEENCEVISEAISTLAHSDTEGFELEECELQEWMQKLRAQPIRPKRRICHPAPNTSIA